MHTQYWGPISRDKIAAAMPLFEKVARKLQQGQIIALPTETVYGLGGSIVSIQTVKNIVQAKKRLEGKPFVIAIACLEQIKFIASDPCGTLEKSLKLLQQFFPGPLTVVVKKNPQLSSHITAGKESVALRFSSDPILQSVIKMTGCPLALTSANISGKLAATKASHVLEDFNGTIGGIVDGGETKYGMESTLLSLENPSKPIILRPGVILHYALEEALKCPVQVMVQKRSSLVHKLKPVVRLFYSWDEMMVYLKLSFKCKRLIMSNKESPFACTYDYFKLSATNLYDGLRLADRKNHSEILVYCSIEIKENRLLLNYLKQVAST